MEVTEEVSECGGFKCGTGHMYTALDYEGIDLGILRHNITGMALIQD